MVLSEERDPKIEAIRLCFRNMNGSEAARVVDLPEICLAAAVAVNSPSFLWIFFNRMHFPSLFWSFILSIILSIAYLHLKPIRGSHESNASYDAEPSVRWSVAYRKYDLVLLAYGIIFAASFAVFALPYLVWWFFLPFHSTMVLALTIRDKNVKPPIRYSLRVGLSILFCIGGIGWPFAFASDFGFT